MRVQAIQKQRNPIGSPLFFIGDTDKERVFELNNLCGLGENKRYGNAKVRADSIAYQSNYNT